MKIRGKSVASAAAVALIMTGCSSGTESGDSSKGDEVTTTTANAEQRGFAQRSADYLAVAAASEPGPDASRSRVWRAVAQLATTDGPVELSVRDLDTITERFATFADTTDFDMVALINLWYRSDFGERLPADTVAHLRSLILDFKYWYTEPQPEGIIDERWYWSENHQILFHTIEYLAGQAFPDEVFTNNGLTGTERMAHARPLIERWIDNRARYGFSEWYSNVYYQEDLEAAVTLAEFSDDADLAMLGTIAADLVLYDVAGHTLDGAFGATQGRTYKKDKMTAVDADTWDMSKLVFDDTDRDYNSETGSVYLASATKYEPPAVLAAVLAERGDAPSPDAVGGTVERARHSLELDALAEVTADVEGPMGVSFEDPDNLMVWWGMAALTPWQTVVQTTNEMTTYNLWATELFSPFKPFEAIVKSSEPDTIRAIARSLAPQLNIGLLSEANTYTWRTDTAMLSTAQDFRKGQASQQHHIWQATLSPDAQVFTTHPRVATEAGKKWHENSDDWTGNATMPRSVQYENLNISIYAPLFSSDEHLQGSYQDYTHAYFPQEHFDEVTTVDNWTFGRVGDQYVALYSWRAPRWESYDPNTHDLNGLVEPFEVVADGGPNNVWITELGSAAQYSTFEAFVKAITAAPVEVTPDGDPAVYSTGFDVVWNSPSQGAISVGWDAPLVVDGDEVELRGYPRIDAPWASVEFDSTSYTITAGGESLTFDVANRTRTSSGSL